MEGSIDTSALASTGSKIEAHYEITESVLSPRAMQDETNTAAFSLDCPVAEYNLQLDDLYENTRLIFR